MEIDGGIDEIPLENGPTELEVVGKVRGVGTSDEQKTSRPRVGVATE